MEEESETISKIGQEKCLKHIHCGTVTGDQLQSQTPA